MRRIVIVGAGQAGLLLALGLQRDGYQVTVVSDRSAEDVRTGRVLSNQCVFDPALRHERALGLNHWDGQVPPITGFTFGAGEPGNPDPVISWEALLDHNAQSVDQRVKMSYWLTEFASRGGDLRIGRATPDDLADFAREADLVLVAAGRGPQFDSVFPRDDERSTYREPQRAISMIYVDTPAEVFPGVAFGLAPGVGEYFGLPVLSVRGPVLGLYFSGIPGGPMDCWDDISEADRHLELSRRQLAEHFPWNLDSVRGAKPAGPLDFLCGRITPVVRHAVGTLTSGDHVLAMGDTAVTNDPIGGQGANNAVHCARIYQQAIVEHGDQPFDEAFMRDCFERYWDYARHSTLFNNDLLEPPPDHVLDTLRAAHDLPEVARRFAHLFNDPTDYEPWLRDEQVARHYLNEAYAADLTPGESRSPVA